MTTAIRALCPDLEPILAAARSDKDLMRFLDTTAEYLLGPDGPMSAATADLLAPSDTVAPPELPTAC